MHAGPENIPEDRGQFDAKVGYRDWIETFQPAFKACAVAGAMSYMCSYNAINGVPSCANRELLTELLRESWKFDGFVVSDCGAVSNVYHRHNFARSDTEAAEFCVKAGCDWNCGELIHYGFRLSGNNNYRLEFYLSHSFNMQMSFCPFYVQTM